MKHERCFVCQRRLNQEKHPYHRKCAKLLFTSTSVPSVAYTREELRELAKRVIAQQISVPGVQEKLSLIQRVTEGERRLTLVGLEGEYILKAPTERYPHMPENEAATMVLARSCGIETAASGLAELSDGTLVYLTRRFDREAGTERHMEDMCQLTERLTEDKYKGSVEQIGKVLYRRSVRPGFDLVTLFELVLFSFLVGNGDMHLKNYALLHEPGVHLAPAFDLLNTRLLIPEHIDNEDTALSINGRRRKLKINDFFILGESLRMTVKQTENVMKRYQRFVPGMFAGIESSFLPEELKQEYKRIVYGRAKRLFLI